MRPLSRGTWAYAMSLAIFAGIIALILSLSGRIERQAGLTTGGQTDHSVSDPLSRPHASATPDPTVSPAPHANAIIAAPAFMGSPLALLLAQLSVVVGFAGACGLLARRLGQPAVIGEMAAGIALGPSLLGHLLPGFSH